jgi:hypothetical protein
VHIDNRSFATYIFLALGNNPPFFRWHFPFLPSALSH